MRTKQLQQDGANDADRAVYNAASGLWEPTAPVFGSEYAVAEQIAETEYTSANDGDVVALPAPGPAGTYRYAWTAMLKHDSLSTAPLMRHVPGSLHFHEFEPRDTDNWICFHGFVIRDSSLTQFISITVPYNTAWTKDVRIERWRVA